MGLGILLGIISIVLILVIVIYNGIITRMNAVERGWANVITQERQKNKILLHLEPSSSVSMKPACNKA
jgi:LemA protein